MDINQTVTLEEELRTLTTLQDTTLHAECVRVFEISESIRRLERIVSQIKESSDDESYSILTRS